MALSPQQYEDRIRALEDEIYVLRRALGVEPYFRDDCGMTGQERMLFSVLARRGDINPEVAEGALHSSGKSTDTYGILHTLICRIRKKVRPKGVTITTRSRYGYVLDAESLKRARMLIYG